MLKRNISIAWFVNFFTIRSLGFPPPTSVFKNSFIAIKFTYHTVHSLKVYSLVVLNIFSRVM